MAFVAAIASLVTWYIELWASGGLCKAAHRLAQEMAEA